MTIAITTNPDGSITVSCGAESVTLTNSVVSVGRQPRSTDTLPPFDLPELPTAFHVPALTKLSRFPRLTLNPNSGHFELPDDILAELTLSDEGVGFVGVVAPPGTSFDVETLDAPLAELEAQLGYPLVPLIVPDDAKR